MKYNSLHNLVTFAQFKKRQKTPVESTFSKLNNSEKNYQFDVIWHMFDYLNELAIAVIINVVFKITKSSLLGFFFRDKEIFE